MELKKPTTACRSRGLGFQPREGRSDLSHSSWPRWPSNEPFCFFNCSDVPHLPEAGAQCGDSALWDLCGGPPERAVPAATHSFCLSGLLHYKPFRAIMHLPGETATSWSYKLDTAFVRMYRRGAVGVVELTKSGLAAERGR